MAGRRSILLLAVAACAFASLAGCAAPVPVEPFHHAFDTQAGLFAPTRLEINRNLPLAPTHQDRLDAVANALAGSKAFMAFGPRVESRYVLDLTLEPLSGEHTSLAAGGSGRRAGAGIAVALDGGRHTHRLTAVVYRDGESTHAYRYVGDFETAWRLAPDPRLPREGAEDILITNLVNHLVRDLDRDHAIARIRR